MYALYTRENPKTGEWSIRAALQPTIPASQPGRDVTSSRFSRIPRPLEVAPQRLHRGECRHRGGLGAQHAWPQAHRGEAAAARGGLLLGREAAFRSRQQHDGSRPAAAGRAAAACPRARAAAAARPRRPPSAARARRSSAATGATGGTRLRPHCSHAAIDNRLPVRHAFLRAFAGRAARRCGRRQAGGSRRRRARPPSAPCNPCARRWRAPGRARSRAGTRARRSRAFADLHGYRASRRRRDHRASYSAPSPLNSVTRIARLQPQHPRRVVRLLPAAARTRRPGTSSPGTYIASTY